MSLVHVVFMWKKRFVFREHAELLSCVNETQRETTNEGTWVVQSVYVTGVEGCSRRVRPLVRWEDRVKEYVSERGVRGHGLYRVCM